MRHVDSDDAAGRSDLLRRKKTIDPRAAAEIDDHLAGTHGRQRLRVAAAEPEIGALRQGGELRLRIAHAAGGALRRGGGAAAACVSGGDAAIPVANQLLCLTRVHNCSL